MATRTLTDKSIESLKPKPTRYAVPDPKLAGHYVRVNPTGAKMFVAVTRDPRGKQIWHTIGSTQLHSIEEARDLARMAMKAIKGGQDRTGPKSVQTVGEEWFKRHVVAKRLITEKEIKRILDSNIVPAWGGLDFESIRRGQIVELLDQIEDNNGPSSADATLKVVRSICNWYATRHENYSSPIVKGMQRVNQKERERSRILSDDEIRAVWKAAESNGTFGAMVRLLLLTAQRRTTVAAIKWEHINGDTWSIPEGNRRLKGTGGDLVLPEMALNIIKAQPRFESSPYILSGQHNGTHYSNFGHGKLSFDSKLPPMPEWNLHDLRRTARTLMARAGVKEHTAERVLGHVQGGVAGIYDRHEYLEEKAQALRMLAGLVENILRDDSEKVRRLRG
jgi:integrase